MSAAAEMLAAFHAAIDDHGPTTELWKRDTLHEEEHRELAEALAAVGDYPERANLEWVARELADVVYVAYGTALTLRVDLDAALEAVHAANMAKMPDCDACDGTGYQTPGCGNPPRCPSCAGRGKVALKRADGKVMKPEGWQPPDMSAAVL